ncbi:MAG: hypothetical protein QOG34_2170 [Frankiaceae bacterium]|nr:hypothetical protein [Frankiaceae bacterium]
MRSRGRAILPAALIATLSMVAAADATGTSVGAGVWGPSNNVSESSSCTDHAGLSDSTCTVSASSRELADAVSGQPHETCTNASELVTTPVIIGTNFGCKVDFNATVTITGTGGDETADGQDTEVEITAGACAGYTISDASATVTDDVLGAFNVPVKVTVTNAGWTFSGTLLGANVGATTFVVLHVAGAIKPACANVKVKKGEASISFKGKFSGSYQFV